MRKLAMALAFLVLPVAWQLRAETYDLRFANATVDWEVAPPQFCLNLQIRGAAGQPDFRIGSHTVFFEYNNAAIDSPQYQTLAFNNLDSCAVAGMVAPYNAPGFSYYSGTSGGDGNLTTIMDFSGFGCPVITDTAWVDMGTVCFQIINASQPINITFDPGVTSFNLNNDNPSHSVGTLQPFDTVLVDLPDGLEDYYGQGSGLAQFQAFPNPFGPNLWLNLATLPDGDEPRLLKVFGLGGEVVAVLPPSRRSVHHLDTSGWAGGIYILAAYNNEGQLLGSLKLLKQ